jgi:hypothetical protein
MKHKINKKLLNGDKGFTWGIRYSSTNETDDIGRWARICYYNGLYIGWVSGFVYGENDKLDNRRTGTVDFFVVSLGFPITSQQHSGSEKFTSFNECEKYVEELFLDFKNFISKNED